MNILWILFGRSDYYCIWISVIVLYDSQERWFCHGSYIALDHFFLDTNVGNGDAILFSFDFDSNSDYLIDSSHKFHMIESCFVCVKKKKLCSFALWKCHVRVLDVNVSTLCHSIEILFIVHCSTFITQLYLKCLIFHLNPFPIASFSYFWSLSSNCLLFFSLSITILRRFRTKFSIRSWFPIQFTWSSAKENGWKIKWIYCKITFVMTLPIDEKKKERKKSCKVFLFSYSQYIFSSRSFFFQPIVLRAFPLLFSQWTQRRKKKLEQQ